MFIYLCNLLIEGNGAFREVRVMYDLYHNGDDNDPGKVHSSPPAVTGGTGGATSISGGDYRAYEVNIPIYPPWSSPAHRPPPPHQQHPAAVHLSAHHSPPSQAPSVVVNGPVESITGGHYHPQYYLEQGMTRPAFTRPPIKQVISHHLVRGKPLFVEVDFVPSK
mgnify:CR=1 FL=1